jgi:hypothetical protein
MRKTLFSVLCVLMSAVGCKDDAETGPPAAAETPAPPAAVQKTEKPRVEPEYTIEIKAEGTPAKQIVSWGAKVPTGGWKLITDSVQVEDRHRELRMATVYATLEEPGDADVTTQAEETVTGRHDAGEQKVDGAELLVRRRVRGVKSDYAPLYANVKRVGKSN